MSLDPSPLSPTPTPLLSPTDPVPSRGSAILGAAISVALALIIAFVATHFGTQLVFFPAGLKTKAAAIPITRPFQIQGFDYNWTKSYGSGTGVGYDDATVAPVIFKSEANDFHMNLTVITITLDQPKSDSTALTGNGGKGNVDTYDDTVYTALVKQARDSGLTPAFKLRIRVTGETSGTWPGTIGGSWSTSDGTKIANERTWFDTYGALLAHYGQLATADNVPFFIIGSELEHLTTDTADTGKGTPTDGETYTCTARRECEWRHMVSLMRTASYKDYGGGQQAGAKYTGKLIYEATYKIGESNTLPNPEWKDITWWNAVDYIGISAFFPLLASNAQSSTIAISDAWKGLNTHAALDPKNTFSLIDAFRTLSAKTNRSIVFTSIGYDSALSASSNPGAKGDGNPDQSEQLSAMTAAITTFTAESWWLGAIWSYDYAVWPRSNLQKTIERTVATSSSFFNDSRESDLLTNTEWAGDCFIANATQACPTTKTTAEKAAGLYLNQTYQVKPIPPNI